MKSWQNDKIERWNAKILLYVRMQKCWEEKIAYHMTNTFFGEIFQNIIHFVFF